MSNTDTAKGCLACIVILVIGFFVGFFIGQHMYVSSNCVAYPFMLLDPHMYVACKLP